MRSLWIGSLAALLHVSNGLYNGKKGTHYGAVRKRCLAGLWYKMPFKLWMQRGLGYLHGSTTLQSLAHSSFDADMASLGIGDIAPELLEELERKRPGQKQVLSTEAMEWVAGFMQIKPGNGKTSLR
jgi:hypothetical protein